MLKKNYFALIVCIIVSFAVSAYTLLMIYHRDDDHREPFMDEPCAINVYAVPGTPEDEVRKAIKDSGCYLRAVMGKDYYLAFYDDLDQGRTLDRGFLEDVAANIAKSDVIDRAVLNPERRESGNGVQKE